MRRRISQLSAWIAAAIVSLVAASAESSTLPPLPQSFVAQEGGWLTLEYPPAMRAKIPELLDAANAVRDELGEALGRPVLWKARARLARDLEEMAALAPEATAPGATSAAYPRLELIVLSLEGAAGEEVDATRALLRELSSLALEEATDGHELPRWFASGFAEEMARGAVLSGRLALISATVRGKLLPVSRLDQALDASSSAALATAQSHDFVRYLQARGTGAFTGLIDRLRQGEPFPSALEGAYGEPSHAIERGFRDQATTRHGYLPILAVIGLVGASAFGFSAWKSAPRRRKGELDVEPLAPELPDEEPVNEEPRGRVRIVVRRRRGQAIAAVDMDVPKIQHDGRWHTLH